MQPSLTSEFLLTEPAFQLFGGMRGPVVQDEDHRLHLAPQGFGNDDLLEKGLEIDEALAAAAGSIYLAIGDGQSSEQVACATTMVARFVQHRPAWARRLLTLACLNGRFLVQTDQPGSCSQENACLGISLEDRASPVQEGLGVMNVLPSVRAPGTKAFGLEPATNRAGRKTRQRGILRHASCQFGSAPARERDLVLARQATRGGRHLRAHLRGKNALAPHCEARQPVSGS